MLLRALLPFLLSLNLGTSQADARLTAVRDEAQLVVQSPQHDILSPFIDTDAKASTTAAQPFYKIAHRVLVKQGVLDALKHGANAVEIDMTAWKKGWWADHDGTSSSAGDTAEAMISTIADQRRAGKTITFVWLDLKNPDHCDPDDSKWRHCSIDALRDLARKYLDPAGVRTLYGFYAAEGKAYYSVRDNLSAAEGIDLNGQENEVRSPFEQGPSDRAKKVMSYGYYNLPFEFGNCRESRYFTCTELRMGVKSQKYGKVFGWTSAHGQTYYVDKLLGEAGIDGLIYGFKATHYYDHDHTRTAAAEITNWVENHPNRRFLATNDHPPW